jgi:hypothetical protein
LEPEKLFKPFNQGHWGVTEEVRNKDEEKEGQHSAGSSELPFSIHPHKAGSAGAHTCCALHSQSGAARQECEAVPSLISGIYIPVNSWACSIFWWNSKADKTKNYKTMELRLNHQCAVWYPSYPVGCLKLQIVPNPMCTRHFPIDTPSYDKLSSFH